MLRLKKHLYQHFRGGMKVIQRCDVVTEKRGFRGFYHGLYSVSHERGGGAEKIHLRRGGLSKNVRGKVRKHHTPPPPIYVNNESSLSV